MALPPRDGDTLPIGAQHLQRIAVDLGATTNRVGALETKVAGMNSGAITLVDAKGDLLVGTADNTAARKAVGTDGQILTSRSTDASGVAWETLKNGQLILRATLTASNNTGSMAAAGISGNFFASAPVITGDNVNYIEVDVAGYAPYISAGTVGHFNAVLYDETLGAAIAKQQFYVTATGISAGGMRIQGFIAPFTGSKTLGLRFENSTAGAATITNQAASNSPTYLSAKWAGSTGHT